MLFLEISKFFRIFERFKLKDKEELKLIVARN